MEIPPFHTASIGAEFLCFSMRYLLYDTTAKKARGNSEIHWFSGRFFSAPKTVSLAVGRNAFFTQVQHFSNFSVAEPTFTEMCNICFVCVGHNVLHKKGKAAEPTAFCHISDLFTQPVT